MPDTVLTEARDRVLLITLNRPEAIDAIDTDLAQGLLAAVAHLDGDDGLTAGVLTGAGHGFLRRHGPQGLRPQRHRRTDSTRVLSSTAPASR